MTDRDRLARDWAPTLRRKVMSKAASLPDPKPAAVEPPAARPLVLDVPATSTTSEQLLLNGLPPSSSGGSMTSTTNLLVGLPTQESREQVHVPDSKAFVTDVAGRTMLTAPAATWEKALTPNKHFLWMQGRFVGAETPNRNNAFWSSGDLELGQASVLNGPLNWLHEARHVIGTIADARYIPGNTEHLADTQAAAAEFAAAAPVSTEDRKKMAKSGVAMPDGSFPIPDVEHLKSAIRLARTPAQRRHVMKRAAALDSSSLIPSDWKNEKSAATADPHIVAASAIWRWIYPDEAWVVQQASEADKLWYSMECISEQVACVGEGSCGTEVAYANYMQGEGCQHMQERSTTRHFKNPTFLGGAVIVPPVRPGWADADASVMSEAAALAEHAYDQAGQPDMSASDWEKLMAQVVLYAQHAR